MQHSLVRLPDGSRALAYQVASLDVIDRRLDRGMDALSSSVLLEGRLARHADGRLEARYAVEGELLSERLERPFTSSEVCALFGCIAQLIDSLIEQRMPLMNMRMHTDEVAMDGASGKARFVFLPLTNITPDLAAAEGFFRAIGESIKTSDEVGASAVRSYVSFFQVSEAFDITAFSKHLKQVVAGALCAEPAAVGGELPTVNPVSAPNDSETTFLGMEQADDHGTTVLVNEEPDDHGTTVLAADEPQDPKNDFGTTVLGDEDDLFANERVLQSRQGLTGVLSDLDFRIFDEETPKRPEPAGAHEDRIEDEPDEDEVGATEPADDTKTQVVEVGPEFDVAPAPEPEQEPEPEGADEPDDSKTSVVEVGEAFEPTPAVESEAAAQDAPDDSLTTVAHVGAGFEPAVAATETMPAFTDTGFTQMDDESEPIAEPEPEPIAEPEPAPTQPAPDAWAVPAPDVAPAPVAQPVRNRFFMTRLRTGESFEIRGRRFVVGKSKHSSFQVRDTTTVSRSHAIFTVENGTCTITDDDSRNGTYVNGIRLESGVPMELVDGDTVRMSDVDFVFEVEPA
ncbi:FHA domain-containing protein [Collinsella tanakaei]|uniref:FHA domain-containing protein n=1 Tax=Collinsella tanakaei TaxID=626935 RepID=UPI0025A403F4|nr:FHA domain-containing protein [Collinsella tanakaei]MDM8300109.1 FHA domain-containing protein [Collinsella tanakaei]